MNDLEKIESNILANSILENLHSLVLVADINGHIKYCSESILRLLKVERSEVLGLGWWKLTRVGENAQSDEIETIKKIISGEIPLDNVPYIKSILSKDRTQYWIQWQDAFGPGNTLIGVGQNVTENYIAQKIIEEQRTQLKLLSLVAEKTDNTVLILDKTGNIEWVSPSFERINKMSLNDLILKNGSSNILTVSNNPNITEVFNNVIEKKISLNYESKNKYVKKLIWEYSTISPVLDEKGEITNLIIIDTDITERKISEEIIRKKNNDIKDSFNYAKRIQEAKLPVIEDIMSALPESFILFKPKDIVSGDFYFFLQKQELIFIAVADSTGHGIPGALMSMLGSEILADSVSESYDPSVILNQLNKKLKFSLRQTSNNDSTRDGMDIALCCIDAAKRVVLFSGANRPIWIYRNNENSVDEIKPTKRAIGGLTDNNQHFEKHQIQLNEGDTFYLFTDGFADQFGGVGEKKLSTKKFKQILFDIQSMPMEQQKEYLDHFLHQWTNGIEQVDDILVFGVRL